MDTSVDSKSQVENLESALLPPSSADDVTKPRVPFYTNLQLTREQEDALVQHALDRIDQLEGQLGRKIKAAEEGGAQDSITSEAGSFFGKRERYTAQYYNKVDWRRTGARPGDAGDVLYNYSNLTLSMSQRITRQGVAKAVNFFLGSPDDDDWFTTAYVGEEDIVLAEKLKRHSRWKARRCAVKDALRQGLEFAFARGEAVCKVTHQNRGQLYQRKATFLVDAAGEPILDKFGDYILQGAPFVEEMMEPEMAEVPADPNDPNEGMPMEAEGDLAEPLPELAMPVPTGRQVLKRDGVTVLPEAQVWKEDIITRRLITFNGPEVKLVYYKDFLCPEAAESVQSADLVAHLFDMGVMQVAEMFQDGIGEDQVANLQQAVERLRELATQNAQPKSATGQPRADSGEKDTAGSPNAPTSQWAECYLTYDANGDGIAEEIMLVVDRVSKAPIFYEYTANVTVRGLRPFKVIRPMEVDGRWYGMGLMEYMDPEQTFVDLQLNRRNFADSAAGRITLFNPNNTVEGQAAATNGVSQLKMHFGGTYTKLEGKKAEDIVETIYLENDGEDFMELLQLIMQAAQLKSGLINAGDQQMSGLPSSELATGINEVRDSGEELFSLVIASLFSGINAALETVIDVMYANMDQEEIFSFFNGDANEVLALTPEEVRDLSLNVTLVLSRSQERREIETSDRSAATVDRFYARLPEVQERTKELERSNLRAQGIPNADKIIEPLAMPIGPDGLPLPPALPGNVEQMPPPAQSVV